MIGKVSMDTLAVDVTEVPEGRLEEGGPQEGVLQKGE